MGACIALTRVAASCCSAWRDAVDIRSGAVQRALRLGDVVNIPASAKHWSGAAFNSWLSHLAIEIPSAGCANEWLEPVGPQAYAQLQ